MPLLDIAVLGIARLNRRYGPAPGGERFLLLHRRRVWSDSEQRWMGWERKRGKLHELNRLLRGATDTTYRDQHRQARRGCRRACATCSRSMPTRGCRAKRRAGSSARWRIRSTARASTRACGRVVEGYAILQPRVTFSLPIERRGLAVPARVLRRCGRRSVRRGGFRRLPGPVRRRLLRRQGHLRRRCVRSRARRPRAGKHAAQPRPVRRHLRARRPRVRHRSGRGISRRATTWRPLRQHRWVRGDWQLLPWIFGRATSAPRRTAAVTAACR